MKNSSLLLTALGFALPASLSLSGLRADTSTFFPSFDNQYLNGANWDLGFVPDLTTANTALLNSDSGAVEYTAGADLTVQNGGVLQINGGSFTQVGDSSWIQLHTGGTLNVNGGTFNQGTAPRFNDMNGTINVTAGTANLGTIYMTSGGLLDVQGGTTNHSSFVDLAAGSTFKVRGGTYINTAPNNWTMNANSTFLVSGGSFTMTDATKEFQPGSDFQSITGGTMHIVGLVAFQGGATQKFDIAGGDIVLDAAAYDGLYSNGGYFNFTLDSTGSILFSNAGAGEQNIFEQQIRYNGTAYNSGDFQTVFDVTHPTVNSTRIALVAVPEPGTVALLILSGLGVLVLRRRTA